MSIIHFKGSELHTLGKLPEIGHPAPHFTLTKPDLSMVQLQDFTGKPIFLNVYPSIDTKVCFSSAQHFNRIAAGHPEVVVTCISMDLPFALQRVCTGEALDQILLLSDFRNREFGDHYGLTIADGPLAGLLARAVIVLDSRHHVVYCELVTEITNAPDYDAAVASLTLHAHRD